MMEVLIILEFKYNNEAKANPCLDLTPFLLIRCISLYTLLHFLVQAAMHYNSMAFFFSFSCFSKTQTFTLSNVS